MSVTSRPVRAARGGKLRCRGWRQEALLRMLENVLEVGERPEDLVVYASLAKAARNWKSYEAIRSALIDLDESQTLIIQSGKPIVVLPTTVSAPLVLMANNNMVGRFATPEVFYARAAENKTVWGGLTGGAWQYIGSQGVLQGLYETFSAAARESFDGSLAGRFVLTSGLGGMGSAQPLALRLLGAVALIVEVDDQRLQNRYKAGSLDELAVDLDAALNAIAKAREEKQPTVVGLCANASDVYSEIASRGIVPDVVTDMTAAHDALHGYVPSGLSPDAARIEAEREPEAVIALAQASMGRQVNAMLALQRAGSTVFENGNNLRVQALAAGIDDALDIAGFAERYIRPLFCRGIGPFRWVALSGDKADLNRLDDLAIDLFPERPEVAAWVSLARANVSIQGLPARSCWLGHGERSRFAVATNVLVATGELKGPVLFSRDHFDAAGMTHPYIGTEKMQDDSDAVADWPLLNALVLSATGADLVAIHGGGGGYSGLMQSAGISIVADGSASAAERLARSQYNDTALGIARYAEAGYDVAIATAEEHNLQRVDV